MELQIKLLNLKIEQLRSELEKFDPCDLNPQVLEASQRLDDVLNKYYALVYKKPKSKRSRRYNIRFNKSAESRTAKFFLDVK